MSSFLYLVLAFFHNTNKKRQKCYVTCCSREHLHQKWQQAYCSCFENCIKWKNLYHLNSNQFLFHKILLLNSYVIGFRLVDFVSENMIVGPHEVPDPPSLAQMTFTSMSELKFDSVAKFSNMCHFRHFLRVSRKTWTKSTGLPRKI